MKRWIVKYFPGDCSGAAGREMRITIAAGLIIGMLWLIFGSFVFLSRYDYRYAKEPLYHEEQQMVDGRFEWILVPSKIEDINVYMSGAFRVLPVHFVLAAVLAGMNYLSFYRPSKSIYLMKRLKSPWELHRRCLTFPVLWIVFAVGICVLLGCFYSHMYFHWTYPDRVPEEVSLNIWRTLVW